MKYIILTFIFFILIDTFFINAQSEWAPVGAKWYYNTPYFYSYESAHGDDCTVIESIGDTVINGKNCKILEVKRCWDQYLISKEYLHQSGDSIFYFNKGDFYLLYNFSAQIGDTVIVHDNKFYPTPGFLFHDTIGCFKYVIRDVDSITINDEWYKKQKVVPIQSCEWTPGIDAEGEGIWITEKLGSNTYFFGRFLYIIPEEEPGLFRCYSDSILEYNNPEWHEDCDYISDNPDIVASENIKFYPNPAIDRFYIETKKQVVLKIYNINGQIVLSKHLNPGTNMIQISFLNTSFLYYCRILSESFFLEYKLIKLKK